MWRSSRFRDRHEAGRRLGERLRELDVDLVVALPRGGVPVACEVARAIGAPLDIGLVRKIGAPDQPELGVGALGEDGTVILDGDTIAALGVDRRRLDAVVASEQVELERRRRLYRGDEQPADVAGQRIVLVDDGVATGVTAVAAARVLRARGAAHVTLAVPVCPAGTGDRLGGQFDAVICLEQPTPFGGVGAWYDDFSQTSDGEVVELLRASRRDGALRGRGGDGGDGDGAGGGGRPDGREVTVEAAGGVALPGTLRAPDAARGLVVFVHGSGSSRLSPRNVAVARRLHEHGFATLLFDLLTETEAHDRRNVFDIDLLARRLLDATRWTAGQADLEGLPTAYFGASTGAAAALRASASAGVDVAAVVSRGGRPDLAGDALTRVTVPTLLIVGSQDRAVLELNEQAAALLGGPHELAVVAGAGHLFEEPGALDEVARLAAGWLARHLDRR